MHAIKELENEVDYVFALAGNPNVGKSTLFNKLTNLNVTTANYPGKTVELNIATVNHNDSKIGIVDLPGTYAIGSVSEDQWVARQAVLETKPDAVIVMVDATNLARNLYIVLQFLDLGFPLIVALNLIDEAEKKGLETDVGRLSALLSVPVVSTVATRGLGIDELIETSISLARRGSQNVAHVTRYKPDIEASIEELETIIERSHSVRPYDLAPRALSILLMEQDSEITETLSKDSKNATIIQAAQRLTGSIEESYRKPAPMVITSERHELAGTVTDSVQSNSKTTSTRSDRLWRYTTAPVSGLAILSIVLTSLFAFLFFVGTFLSEQFSLAWSLSASPVIKGIIGFIAGEGIVANVLNWGFNAGIEATLAVGIPYVLTFYFLLALLEDTGYLNSVAFLTDRLLHRFGLHGRAMIPLVAAAGCNVPAIIGTRVLSTQRERIVASTMITLVPCSARTAVVIGALAFVGGWQPAAAIFALVLFLIVGVGLVLDIFMPSKSPGLIMEMFPFRMPLIKSLFKKTWARFMHFIMTAAPVVIIGSLVLGFLYETGLIWKLAAPLSPIIEGWLGLPAVAGLTLIFAILRKELALQLLVTLAIVQYGTGAKNLLTFMNGEQLFVYALVNTIYIPCVATIAVLARELSWKIALAISAFTVVLAITIGGIVMRVITAI